MRLKILTLLVLFAAASVLPEALCAQAADSTAVAKVPVRRKKKEDKIPNLTFRERVAIKTNTVDWALIIANAGVEFDLSSSPYNRLTLGANIRYNGGSHQTFSPNTDFKLLDAKLELRRYWRESLTIKQGQKRKPKYWRAYYWGIYAGYTDYTLHFRGGYKGSGITLGGSFGYEIPLYVFKHAGVLDLDLGLSGGFMAGKYQKSKVEDGVRVITKDQDFTFIPFPMVSEIRVGLVYRFKSIRDKYNRSKH